MHYTDGSNNAAGQFTNGPPGTTLEARWVNAVQMEIINLLLAGGVTIAASGSADQTAGYHQVRDMFQALGVPQTVAATTVNSGTFSLEVAAGLYAILETGGPFAGGTIKLLDSGSGGTRTVLSGQKVILVNKTGSTKIIKSDSVSATARTVQDGEGIEFVYLTNYWAPLRVLNTDSLAEGATNLYFTNARADARAAAVLALATTDNLAEGITHLYFTTGRVATALSALDLDSLADSATRKAVSKSSGTFTMHLYDSANADLANGTATWEIIDGWVHVEIPQMFGTAAAGNLRLTQASDAVLPTAITPATTIPRVPIAVAIAGAIDTAHLELNTSGKFNIKPWTSGPALAGGGSSGIYRQTIKYRL